MHVDNIFKLLNKFSKQEDQISAAYGFILKNNVKILQKFLDNIEIYLKPKEFKNVDIETQVTYDSGESRIDLQLTIYDKFLVFIESKLYKSGNEIIKQLEKYRKILEIRKIEYDNNVRLVYVNKQPIKIEDVNKLRLGLKLPKKEFFFFSWEDLINITEVGSQKETVKLFKNYIGDTMYSKKVIEEQKIKDIVEVLVIYTNPDFWKLTKKKNLAVQRNSAPDAKYIAFLRTHRVNKKRSAITHIAEVKYTKSHVPRKNTFKGFPGLIAHTKERGHDLDGTHKHYILSKMTELSREIPHLKGEGTKAQVNFSTKLSELLRVKSVGEIKTLSKLRDV